MTLTPQEIEAIIGLGQKPSVPTKQDPVKEPEQVKTSFDTEQRKQEIETQQSQSQRGAELAKATPSLGPEQTQAVEKSVKETTEIRNKQIEILDDYKKSQDIITGYENWLNNLTPEQKNIVGKDIVNKVEKTVSENKPQLVEYGKTVDAITNPNITNVIDFDQSGRFSIDVQRALQYGVPKQQLYDANVRPTQVVLAQERIEQGKPSNYMTPEKAKIQENLQRIIYNTDKRVFEATHTQLKDGYISNTELEQVKKESPQLYGILMDEGLQAYNSQVKGIKNAVDILSNYPVMVAVYNEKGVKTFRPSLAGQIDLVAAYKDGKQKEINLLYGKDTINEIKDYISVETARNEFSKYSSLNTALLGGMSEYQLEKIFSKKEIDQAKRALYLLQVAEENVLDYEEKFKKGKLSPLEAIGLQNNIEVLNNATSAIAAGELAVIIPQGINRILDKYVGTTSKLLTEKLPPVLSIPARYAIGWFVERPLYATSFAVTALGIIGQANPLNYAKNVANGIGDFFKSIPAKIKADPESAANIVGVFVSPNTIKTGATILTDPSFVPYQGLSYAFSTNKLPVTLAQIQALIKSGKLTEVKIANAIYQAQKLLEKNPKIDATVKIAGTGLELTAKTTPWLKRFGSTLFHATPDYSPFLKDFIVKAIDPKEPALFTSQHAAGRFAITSAKGVAGIKPALIAIYTKSGIKNFPAVIRDAKDLSTMTKRGFEYLGSGKVTGAYSVIKTYARRFEDEVLIAVGTDLVKAKNFRSRLLGVRAGEFVTVIDGNVVPIIRMAEKGAKLPSVSLAQLAALRVEVFIKTLKRLRIDPQALVLYLKKERGLSLSDLANEFEKIGNEAKQGLKGEKAEVVYRRAVDDAMAKEFRAMYQILGKRLESYYKVNAQKYEETYSDVLERELANRYETKIIRPKTQQSVRLERQVIDIPERPITLTDREIRQTRNEIERNRENISRINTIREPIETARIEVDRIDTIRTTEIIPPEIRQPRVEPVREITIKTTTKIIPTKVSDENVKRIKKNRSPICWRQGFGWWVLKYPWREDKDLYFTREKPKGAFEVKGIGSAYRTIQALGGNPDILIRKDLGIVDVTVRGTTIEFKRKKNVKRKSKEPVLKGVRK